MSWSQEQLTLIDLAQDGQSRVLTRTGTSLSDRAAELVWRLGDTWTQKLIFFDRAQSTTASVELESGSVIVLAAKLSTGGVVSGNVLFSATPFSVASVSDDKVYSALVDLSTPTHAELVAALAGKAEITVQVDIEIQNAANTKRLTVSFLVKIKPESYAAEGVPAPYTPGTYLGALGIIGRVNGTAYLVTIDDTDPDAPTYVFTKAVGYPGQSFLPVQGSVNGTAYRIYVDDTDPDAPVFETPERVS